MMPEGGQRQILLPGSVAVVGQRCSDFGNILQHFPAVVLIVCVTMSLN